MYNSTISEKTNHHSALFSAIYMLFRNGIWAKCSIKYRESDALFKFGEKKDEYFQWASACCSIYCKIFLLFFCWGQKLEMLSLKKLSVQNLH